MRRLQAMHWPPFAAMLAALETELVSASLPKADASPPEVGLVTFDSPLWTRGLFEPDWLLPSYDEAAPLLALFTFANQTLEGDAPQIQMADHTGRLTRGLPIYLAEALQLRFRVRTRTTLLVAKHHAMAGSGAPPGRGRLHDLARARESRPLGALKRWSACSFEARSSPSPGVPRQQRLQRAARVIGGGQVGELAGELPDLLAGVLPGAGGLAAKVGPTAKGTRPVRPTSPAAVIEGRTISERHLLARRVGAQRALQVAPFDGPEQGLAPGQREATTPAALRARPAAEQRIGVLVEDT